MKITVFGTGPVGLVNGLVLAKFGHKIQFVDHDSTLINLLNKKSLPFYEPGLKKLFKNAIKRNSIRFTTLSEFSWKKIGRVALVCVKTENQNKTDLTSLKNLIHQACLELTHNKQNSIIIIKSTLSPGTYENELFPLVKENKKIELVLAPEFLREGEAVSDLLSERRILLSSKNAKLSKRVKKLYGYIKKPQFFLASPTQVEYTKYVSNSFFANLISLSNDWGRVAERLPDVNLNSVIQFLEQDNRLQNKKWPSEYLRAGIGFGGSCLTKDLNSFVQLAKSVDTDTPLLKAILETNLVAKQNLINLCHHLLQKKWTQKKVSILGLSFKAHTSDTRMSLGLFLAKEFIKRGSQVSIFDPHASLPDEFKQLGVIEENNIEQTLKGSSLCVLTNFDPNFLNLNEEFFKKTMKRPMVIDGRGILQEKRFKQVQYFTPGISLGVDEEKLSPEIMLH